MATCGRKPKVHNCYFSSGSAFAWLVLIFIVYLISELKIGMRDWKSEALA